MSLELPPATEDVAPKSEHNPVLTESLDIFKNSIADSAEARNTIVVADRNNMAESAQAFTDKAKGELHDLSTVFQGPIQDGRRRAKEFIDGRKGRKFLGKLLGGGDGDGQDRGERIIGGKGRRLDQRRIDKADAKRKVETEKIEYPKNDLFGLVRELHVPKGFNPANNGNEFIRDFRNEKTNSAVSYYNGTELPPEAQAKLKDLLANHSGELKPNSPELMTAASIIGSGYQPFTNKPEFKVETLNGKKVIVMTDQIEHEQLGKFTGYTIFAPSQEHNKLFTISYTGTTEEFANAKQALAKTKWH